MLRFGPLIAGSSPTPTCGCRLRLARAACVWLLAAAISGCASLPRDVVRPVSQAIAMTKVQESPLAKATEASRPGGDLSGFRLLPTGAYAFNTLVALARRARHTLDAQYYIVEDDETGRAILKELQTAAARGVRVLSLTDHDSTEGFAEAKQAAQRLGLRLIPRNGAQH